MRIHSLVICLLKWSLLPRQVKDEKPPAPTRGVAPKGEDEEDGGEAADSNSSKGGEDAGVVNLADLVPRNDIRFANVLLLFCVRMKKYTLKEALSINALHACVCIDILKLSSFRAPTLLFIDLTVATCNIQFIQYQFVSRENYPGARGFLSPRREYQARDKEAAREKTSGYP